MRTGTALLFLLGPLSAQQSTIVQPLFAGFRPGVDCAQPHLTTSSMGPQALVFVASGNSVILAIREGQQWREPVLVADLPDLASGNHRGPRVAWAGEALLVACIESRFDAGTRTSLGSGNLTVRRSTDLGAHWSAPVTINGEAGSAREGLHAIAAAGLNVAVVWLDQRAEPKASRVWCALSTDGGVTFGKDFLAHGAKEPVCPCCHPSLGYGEKGPIVLWRDAIAGNRDMYTGLIPGQGKPITAPQAAGKGHWRLPACPMDGGGLALTSSSRPVSVWRRDETIYWASYGREYQLGKGRNPALAISDRKAMAVWESGGKLVAARFDPDQKDAKDPKDGKAGNAALLDLGAGAFPCVAPCAIGFTVTAEIEDRGHKRIAAIDL